MPFKQGHSGNPKGRPKGAEDKTTKDLRNSIRLFLEGNIVNLQDDFNKLEPRDKIRTLTDFMRFSIPTLKAIEGSLEINEEPKGTEVFDFSQLTEEEVRQYKNIMEKAVHTDYHDNRSIRVSIDGEDINLAT